MNIISRLLSCLSSKRSGAVYLTKLPTHILLQICDYLPSQAKGCLVLTSKTFSYLLPYARSGLRLPSEFSMAKETVDYPLQWQNQRYIFLRLLEVDLHPHQFLCWDCFTLHSRTAFSKFRRLLELRICWPKGRIWTKNFCELLPRRVHETSSVSGDAGWNRRPLPMQCTYHKY